MRAVATALVLIVGAAVVLWYGNTLNSWVLGGLIGGLAALLLSIPISLTLFVYLARRHDERHPAEEEELAEPYDYEEAYIRPSHVIESIYERRVPFAPPARSTREIWDDEEERLRAFYDEQRMPSYRHLPASGKTSARRNADESLYKESLREDGAIQKRITRKMPAPGVTRSQLQSAALHLARKEAAQQFDGFEEDPSRFSRRPQSRGLSEPSVPREQMPNVYPRHRRLQREPRSAHSRQQQPETDYLREAFLQTDQINYPPARPREGNQNPETTTDNLQRPMVRRAPYLYEDDPLRQELSQYVDEPITRRSSRLDSLRPRKHRDDV